VTTDAAPTRTASAAERRSVDLQLARLHLRIGSLSLARAEFETLAGRGPLDDDAIVDLAEVRWRTGDTIRAGEAAATALEHGVEAPLALIITAEAAVAVGRPGEAARLATRAMSAAGGTLDALFAGMPRSAVWPPDPADPAPLATTLFGDDREAVGTAAANAHSAPDTRPHDRRATDLAAAAATATASTADGDSAPTEAPAADGSTPGLWDGDLVPVERPVPLAPSALMDAGLAAIAAGDPDRAASLLGLAVRAGPHLAPAILDGTLDATEPGILLVRGDAFRAVGSETEASAAYAAAARALQDVTPDDPDAALQSGPTTTPSQ